MDRQDIRKYFEGQGSENIRALLLSGNLSQEFVPYAAQWLGELDALDRARNEASQASQERTALSAKNAAWIAAIAAIVAAVIAIIGIAVTIMTWLFPRP